MANPFLKMFAAFGNAGQMVAERKARREALLQQLDEHNAMPITKADALQICFAGIEDMQRDYGDRLTRAFHQQFCQHGKEPPKSMPAVLAPWSGMGVNHIIPQAVFALFGDQVKGSIEKIVDAMPWPEPGLPLAQRQIEVEKINRELEKIEGELADLQAAAGAVGVQLQGVAASSVPKRK